MPSGTQGQKALRAPLPARRACLPTHDPTAPARADPEDALASDHDYEFESSTATTGHDFPVENLTPRTYRILRTG
jgi:hypothetical protein